MEPVAQAAPQIAALKSQYQAASQTGAVNPGWIGTGGALTLPSNGGVQHQFGRGIIVSADNVHNATRKLPLVLDVNHVGAARYLNVGAAQAAIAGTTGSVPGCPGGISSAAIDCAIPHGRTGLLRSPALFVSVTSAT